MSPRPEALFLHDGVGRLFTWEAADAVLRLFAGFLAVGVCLGTARALHGGICPWSVGCRADYGEGVGGAPDGGGEKPVVPVLVSPSRKDGDDLSALKEVRMGFSIGTGYLAEFAVQWNSIELAWCHFRRRMTHPITVPNNEVRSPSAMTSETYSSRLGMP